MKIEPSQCKKWKLETPKNFQISKIWKFCATQSRSDKKIKWAIKKIQKYFLSKSTYQFYIKKEDLRLKVARLITSFSR